MQQVKEIMERDSIACRNQEQARKINNRIALVKNVNFGILSSPLESYLNHHINHN